jgi:hypothetical protein
MKENYEEETVDLLFGLLVFLFFAVINYMSNKRTSESYNYCQPIPYNIMPTGEPEPPTGIPTVEPEVPTGMPTVEPEVPTDMPTGDPELPAGIPTSEPEPAIPVIRARRVIRLKEKYRQN